MRTDSKYDLQILDLPLLEACPRCKLEHKKTREPNNTHTHTKTYNKTILFFLIWQKVCICTAYLEFFI